MRGRMGRRQEEKMREHTIREVEQFLYREARLLDARRFHEWLELFTDDVRYWMVTRSNRYPRASKAIAVLDPARLPEPDPAQEEAPSRTRHLITNIEVAAGDTEAEVKVYANFVVYRSRAESEQDFYVGAREDVLRRQDGGWKIARRRLVLDQNVLTAKNVSIFF